MMNVQSREYASASTPRQACKCCRLHGGYNVAKCNATVDGGDLLLPQGSNAMPPKGIARQLAYYLSFDGLGSGGGAVSAYGLTALRLSMCRRQGVAASRAEYSYEPWIAAKVAPMAKEYRRHRHKYDRKKEQGPNRSKIKSVTTLMGLFLFGTMPGGEINATPPDMKQHRNEQDSDDRPKEGNLGDGILHSGWKGRWIRSSCVRLVPFACQVLQAPIRPQQSPCIDGAVLKSISSHQGERDDDSKKREGITTWVVSVMRRLAGHRRRRSFCDG
ncbi:hypothetical protein BC826DRAFT_613925 [Russula brevipes]|nr:hypothetical protein BC826DRAFT_613925 [Russula brevipes]